MSAGDALEGLVDEALDKAGEGLETLTKKLPKASLPRSDTDPNKTSGLGVGYHLAQYI